VGLAEIDVETNVVPHAARSWKVLDGGRRYIFHLRDDIRWTDGTPLTAMDFEETWKRNLAPGMNAVYVEMLDDIVGARDYREGRNPDPNNVGVRALDRLTLEVRLSTPVAYFIYLVSQPVTFAIPLKLVEEYGEDWWKPEHIICNGPFRLVQFGSMHGLLERNPEYFGEFSGNLDQYSWKFMDSAADALREYLDGRADYLGNRRLEDILEQVPANEFIHYASLATWGLNLIPLPPLDDIRVRRAIVHAIDRKQLSTIWGSDPPSSNGGIVPPGIPGHSPELGLEFDPEQARQLLAQAGYSTMENFPVLKYYYDEYSPWRIQEELRRQLLAHLGMRVELIPLPTATTARWAVQDALLQWGAWVADYPDPDNFLRGSTFHRVLWNRGWRHPRLEQLLEEAAHTTDRARRLALYREADRILVNEEAVVMPLTYSSNAYIALLKPWVRGYKRNALNNYSLKDIVIEPH
jgi:ABC-type oligopeptide transport system substrate-binding subunit